MESNLIHRYIEDARVAYQACLGVLAPSETRLDLSGLLRAARRQQIERRGKVTTPNGLVYDYHVHGAGYTFKERSNGCKVIRFDVMTIEGTDHIRFSAWDLVQYAASIDRSISEEMVSSELLKQCDTDSFIIHVLDGPFDYYYCSENVCSVEGSPCPPIPNPTVTSAPIPTRN